jgi:hypothetical protein
LQIKQEKRLGPRNLDTIGECETIGQKQWLKGGCIVGWTNFGIMQSIFLSSKCDSNYNIFLYIMELLNGIHFEIMYLNNYVMKLIGM